MTTDQKVLGLNPNGVTLIIKQLQKSNCFFYFSLANKLQTDAYLDAFSACFSHPCKRLVGCVATAPITTLKTLLKITGICSKVSY